MKIFSWVHRHFHHKEKSDNNIDKVALLENEALCDHHVWKEGILAIGTFGSTHLFQDNHKPKQGNINQVVFFGDVDVDVDDDHDEEMECPLVLNNSEHGFDHVKEQDLPSFDADDEIPKPKTAQEDSGGMKCSMKIKKHGERTTLADLLRADSETNILQNDGLSDHDRNIKVPYNDNDTGNESIKSFLIFKNKNKLVKDDSAQPIKKTKQLIKRMLKKKIHPDITGNQKTETTSTATRETDVLAT